MDWVDYREKLGIGFDDTGKFEIFRNKMGVFLDTLGDELDSFATSQNFSHYYIAIGEVAPYNNYFDFGLVSSNILDSPSLKLLISKIVALINTADTCCPGLKLAEHICNSLIQHLKASHIPFEVLKDDDSVFFFPKGASELDKALVSQPLAWLNDYPNSHTAWVKALKEYADETDENTSEIADKFRKALETFFQEFFGGQKSLENYKSDYGKYLKDQGIPKEISGNIETVLQAYTNYMNSYAKHRDATSDNVLEYIMYQTGNIIRLLITLRQEEPDDAH